MWNKIKFQLTYIFSSNTFCGLVLVQFTNPGNYLWYLEISEWKLFQRKIFFFSETSKQNQRAS